MKPLLLTALGHPLIDAPLGRRGDDVEVRRIPALPTAGALELERPTVIALDRSLLASAGEGAAAQLRSLAGLIAIVGIGEPGDREPAEQLPGRRPDELHPRRRDDGHRARGVSRRVPTRRGARRRSGTRARPPSIGRASSPS